jgi:hypothetical protein
MTDQLEMYKVEIDGKLFMIAPLTTISAVFDLEPPAQRRVMNEPICHLHFSRGRWAGKNITTECGFFSKRTWQ